MKPHRSPGRNSGRQQSKLWMAVVCVYVLLTGRAPALDPSKELTEYNCQTWSRQNGLMINGVNAIAQTADGYLWLGTSSGLIQYDGLGFTTLPPPKAGNHIVTTLAAARDGGLWVGLENNVISYHDSAGWATNRAVPTDIVGGNNRSLQEDKDGTLIIVSGKQLAWRTPAGNLLTVDSLSNEHDDNIMCGFRDSQSRFWHATADGVVSYWQAGAVHLLQAPEIAGHMIFAMTEDHQGNLWVGGSGGLFCYDAGLHRKMITPFEPAQVTTLLVDRQGVLWIGSSNRGLARYQNGKYDFFTKAGGLASNAIKSLMEDREGSLWVGTRNGVSQLSDVKFPTAAAAEDPGVLDAVSVSAARQGGVWIGTPIGVTYWNGRPQNYATEAGVTNTFIKRVLEARNGNLYLINGIRNELLVLAQEKIVAKYTSTNMLVGLAEDEKGVVVSAGGELYRVNARDFTPYAFTNDVAPPLYWVNDLEPGRNGFIWAGSVNGLARIKGGTFEQWTVDDGLTDVRVDALCEDSEGTVWGAMKTGIARVKPGPTTSHRPLEFSPDDLTNLPLLARELKQPSDPVSAYLVTNLSAATLNALTNYHGPPADPAPLQTALAQSLSDVVGGPSIYDDRRFAGVVLRRETKRWLAQSPPGGLRRLNRLLLEDAYPEELGKRPSQIECISEADGLFDNNVYAIVPDDLGNLWMDAGRGIFRVSRQSLSDFADGRTERVECKAFDGLESVKPSDKISQEKVGCKSLDGRIWFPNPNGVVMINPRQIQTNYVAPPVHIQSIQANGREYRPGGSIVVPPGHGELGLGYAALSFIAPQRIQFRYQLEGYDPGWVEAGTRRQAFFTNLKPGHYTFRVIAANADGIWNQTGASVGIELRPHYYQTDWFYSGCGVLLFTGLAGGYGGFVRRMRHKAQRLQEARDRLEREVNLRTQELSYERDLLRGLMDYAPDQIYFKDAKSRFIRSSKSVAEKIGMKDAGAMVGKTDFDLFDEQHARPAYEDEQQIMHTGRPMEGKVEREVWKDGRVSWALTSKLPLRDRTGQIIGTLGISKDITAMKQTEAELAYERDLLRSLLDNSPDSIYFKDRELRWVRVSRSEAKHLQQAARSRHQSLHPGERAEDLPPHLASLERFEGYLIGKTDADIYGPERAEDFRRDEQEIMRTGRPMIGKTEHTTGPDGKNVWFMTTKVPWRNPQGEIIGTFGASRDISALKQAEAKVEEIHKRLLETSRQAGMAEVATNVLHNVGNVLNSVNVSATLMLDSTKKSQLPYLAKVVAMLEEHAADLGGFLTQDSRGRELPAFLNRLAGQLAREQALAISELEMLRQHIEHIKEVVAMQQSYAKISGVVETLQMADLAEDALRMNIGALDRHHIQLVRDYHDLPPVMAEKHKIIQILVNLIRNAKYACDESGRTDKVITLQLAPVDDGVRIAVIDNGVGIPPEIQSRLFDHGFTTRKGGHGFGLHSGALTARELGGTLTASSAGRGQGATFTLLLPLHPPNTETGTPRN